MGTVPAKANTRVKVLSNEITSLSLKSIFLGSAILLPVLVFKASFFSSKISLYFPPDTLIDRFAAFSVRLRNGTVPLPRILV